MASRKKRVAQTLTKAQAQWKMQMPVDSRANYDKAISGIPKASAVKVACLDCMGWQRSEVRDCMISTCPLWPYRPYQPRG